MAPGSREVNEPLVAIVVPVYNGAPHLGECLQSILDQTYPNWNAVVVNNCSTDASGQIADEFARRDRRLQVVHCEHFVGQSENYNRSVAHAQDGAEYVKLLEADNWITRDCIAEQVQLAEEDKEIGIVACNWLLGKHLQDPCLEYTRRVLSGVEVIRLLFLESAYLFGTPTTLLFRRKALQEQSVWFRPDVFYDDTDLCMRILRHWKFGFVHQLLAFVRDDNHGAFSRIRSFDFVNAYMYFLITAYGREFFGEREFHVVRQTCRKAYYDRLGRAAVAGRGSAYWEFHHHMFRAAGGTLRRRDLLLPTVRALLDAVLNPKASVERLCRRRRRRPLHADTE